MLGFLRKVAFWKRSDDADVTESPAADGVTGFNGDLNVGAVLLFEDDRAVLSVDYDFPDVPSYVEFDLGSHHIHVVQQGGDVATLSQLTLPKNEYDRITPMTSIALLTGTEARDDKLVQMVSLIVKEPVAPAAYSF